MQKSKYPLTRPFFFCLEFCLKQAPVDIGQHLFIPDTCNQCMGMFEPQGVVSHYGDLHGGHYITLIGKAAEYDDAQTIQVGIQRSKEIQQNAYLVLLKKVDTQSMISPEMVSRSSKSNTVGLSPIQQQLQPQLLSMPQLTPPTSPYPLGSRQNPIQFDSTPSPPGTPRPILLYSTPNRTPNWIQPLDTTTPSRSQLRIFGTPGSVGENNGLYPQQQERILVGTPGGRLVHGRHYVVNEDPDPSGVPFLMQLPEVQLPEDAWNYKHDGPLPSKRNDNVVPPSGVGGRYVSIGCCKWNGGEDQKPNLVHVDHIFDKCPHIPSGAPGRFGRERSGLTGKDFDKSVAFKYTCGVCNPVKIRLCRHADLTDHWDIQVLRSDSERCPPLNPQYKWRTTTETVGTSAGGVGYTLTPATVGIATRPPLPSVGALLEVAAGLKTPRQVKTPTAQGGNPSQSSCFPISVAELQSGRVAPFPLPSAGALLEVAAGLKTPRQVKTPTAKGGNPSQSSRFPVSVVELQSGRVALRPLPPAGHLLEVAAGLKTPTRQVKTPRTKGGNPSQSSRFPVSVAELQSGRVALRPPMPLPPLSQKSPPMTFLAVLQSKLRSETQVQAMLEGIESQRKESIARAQEKFRKVKVD
jgi:hypothetical protein